MITRCTRYIESPYRGHRLRKVRIEIDQKEVVEEVLCPACFEGLGMFLLHHKRKAREFIFGEE